MCTAECYEDDEIRTYRETVMLSDGSHSIHTNSIPHEWSMYLRKFWSEKETTYHEWLNLIENNRKRGDLVLTNPMYSSDFTIILNE